MSRLLALTRILDGVQMPSGKRHKSHPQSISVTSSSPLTTMPRISTLTDPCNSTSLNPSKDGLQRDFKLSGKIDVRLSEITLNNTDWINFTSVRLNAHQSHQVRPRCLRLWEKRSKQKPYTTEPKLSRSRHSVQCGEACQYALGVVHGEIRLHSHTRRRHRLVSRTPRPYYREILRLQQGDYNG
jgi:hypothetical protein